MCDFTKFSFNVSTHLYISVYLYVCHIYTRKYLYMYIAVYFIHVHSLVPVMVTASLQRYESKFNDRVQDASSDSLLTTRAYKKKSTILSR